MSGDLIFTNRAHYQAIATALREKLKTNEVFTPAQMAPAIRSIKSGGGGLDIDVVTGDSGPWTRPVEWPNLDAIPIDYANDEEVVYLTYDNTQEVVPKQNCWAGFYATTGGKNAYYTVECGTVTNGVFTPIRSVSSEPQTNAGDSYGKYVFDFFGDDEADYPVYRIKCAGGGHLQRFYFASITTEQSGLSSAIYPIYQPCVERVGNLPWINSLGASGTSVNATYRWGTNYLQRDATAIAKRAKLTSLSCAWQYCRSLRILDMSRWDTSGWAVTSLTSTWQYCFFLGSLDFSNWDTSAWKVGTLQSTWNYCSSIKELDLSGWNTSGWTVNSLAGTWQYCYSLSTLDTSGWDTSKWKVTSLNATWNFCYSLKELNVSHWNTSGWTVNTITLAWSACYHLAVLDLSSWDVSNWAVTTLAKTWSDCFSLETLDTTGWDTFGWAVTTLDSTWLNCYLLEELDLSHWDVSNWTVNTLNATWSNCWSLLTLDTTGWDTSGWAVTVLSYTWRSCESLRELDVSHWNTSGWAVTTLAYAWAYCYSLQELDLSHWDVSKWKVTTMTYGWSYCYSLKELDISDWDVSNWTTFTTFQYAFRQMRAVRTIKLGSLDLSKGNAQQAGTLFEGCNYLVSIDGLNGLYNQAIDLGSAHNLTPASIRALFNSIGTNSSNKNFKVHATAFQRLLPEDIAIATAKKWNVTT